MAIIYCGLEWPLLQIYKIFNIKGSLMLHLDCTDLCDIISRKIILVAVKKWRHSHWLWYANMEWIFECFISALEENTNLLGVFCIPAFCICCISDRNKAEEKKEYLVICWFHLVLNKYFSLECKNANLFCVPGWVVAIPKDTRIQVGKI